MKLPSIRYLPWSGTTGKPSDNCTQKHVKSLREKEPLVYTEKLDGECTFLSAKSIHARSEDGGYQAPWQTFIKRHWATTIAYHIPDGIGLFCESLFAIHSIEYTKLPDYLFLFGAVDLRDQMYLSWMDTVELARRLKMRMVPIICQGGMAQYPILGHSTFGPECEGYVVRTMQAFPMSDFQFNMAKSVRPDHVQTDEHWTKHWKQAKLISGSPMAL